MTIKDLLTALPDELISVNEADFSRTIDSVYCCDLLSFAMGRASAGSAWVTCMGNVNSVAVAVLTDVSVIVLAENAVPESVALERAADKRVNLIKTALPIFDVAKKIDALIGGYGEINDRPVL